jgi:hypothetical protein
MSEYRPPDSTSRVYNATVPCPETGRATALRSRLSFAAIGNFMMPVRGHLERGSRWPG